MVENRELYRGREQTWVKHYVLRKYLERFAHIIGWQWSSITYVDGFSGPWKVQSEEFDDTSFSIALRELRKARETHAQRGKELRIRCVFVEPDSARYDELKRFADEIHDAEVQPLNSSFEAAIPRVIRFVKSDRETFPFIFIDPTGWTGFSMKSIAPLLKLQPSEVLINFMMKFIRRFIEDDFSRDSFLRLFGTEDYDEGLRELSGDERDDAIAQRYCHSLRTVCGFVHVHRAIILHPDRDQGHFQLIYGTHHPKGVQVFKEVEKQAMEEQGRIRARVEWERENRPLFKPDDMPASTYERGLRDRYLRQAKDTLADALNSRRQMPYNDLWLQALSYPTVWESDLRVWLTDWRRDGFVRWEGLKRRERVLKCNEGHSVVRLQDVPR